MHKATFGTGMERLGNNGSKKPLVRREVRAHSNDQVKGGNDDVCITGVALRFAHVTAVQVTERLSFVSFHQSDLNRQPPL